MLLKRFFKIGLIPALFASFIFIVKPPGYTLPAIAAIILHEVGHLVAARVLKVPMNYMEIGIGGVSLRTRSAAISYTQELLLCVAGPLINLLSYALIRLGALHSGCSNDMLLWFADISLALGILNLIPIEGFDGSRIIFCLLTQTLGPNTAYRIMHFISFLAICALWMLSIYILMRGGVSLSLFAFCVTFFLRIFLGEAMVVTAKRPTVLYAKK